MSYIHYFHILNLIFITLNTIFTYKNVIDLDDVINI